MNTQLSASGQNCPPCETAPEILNTASPETALEAETSPESPPVKEAPPIPTTKIDFIFALLWCVLGYGFVYCFSTPWEPALTVYTPIYAGTVLAFVYKSGLRPPKESWFWLAALLCAGMPLPFYSVLGVLQFLALLCIAAYFTLSAAGVLLDSRTSNWLPLDIVNALCVVPFGNFTNHIRVFVHGVHTTKPGRNLLTIGLGLLLALPLLAIILPLLSGADTAFSTMLYEMSIWIQGAFGENLLRLIVSLPVTAFLFGLAHGAIHRRRIAVYSKESVYEGQKGLHCLPNLAITTALCMVCGVYLLFIGLQSSYLFSAFRGIVPDGFSYAEYARQGFFELCQSASFNVFIILTTGILTKTPRKENKALRLLSIALSGLSLLLIAIAASKMALYINTFGLTQLRVLTSVFMLWLAFVFIIIIAWQFIKLPVVRLAVFSGACLFCLLCVIDVGSCIAAYNQAGNFIPDTALQPGMHL